MATKVKLMKLIQERVGYDVVTNRRPPPRLGGLYLMELRSHTLQLSLPKRRLAVAMPPSDISNTPRPVRITHAGRHKLTPVAAAR